ncbi:MAG: PEP/pyruvate-binding domain-containing protein [Nostocaceae cyanobacterium]|nr:PEP/pyruvate-binding domain-containing protein [Nostocaceae cyanobacterium]
MDKLYWLDQIKPQDRPQVGDKALHLGRLMQRGYPVIPGFVVSAQFLRDFLETLNSSEALVADLPNSSLHLDVTNWRQLQQVTGRLRQEIITGTVAPQLVSNIVEAARLWNTSNLILRPSVVVPSRTQEFTNLSGLLESIFCRCQPEAITQGLKSSWNQIFRAKSLLFWQKAGINLQKINLAVLVQPVHSTIASGVFNANSSIWEIQATWGLGLAIAHGELLPDIYHLEPETGTVKKQQLGNKILGYTLADVPATWQTVPLEVLESDNSGLIACLVKSAQQQQYALSAEYLQQLIQLAKQLVGEVGENFTLDWTICNQSTDSKLYLTQITTPQSAVFPNLEPIKGLAAATGRETATAYVIASSQQKYQQIPPGAIIVASAIAPDWLPFLQNAAGIVTEQGGLTSHAAILARELSIPAVVNAHNATTLIQTGEQLLIDGDKGEVYPLNLGKREQKDKLVPNHRHSQEVNLPQPRRISPDSSIQQPVIVTQLLLNLSQNNLIEQALSLPVDGIGLLRSEMMAMGLLGDQHPQNWLAAGRKPQLLQSWYDLIIEFVRAFAPRPVFYRSLDWRSPQLASSHENLSSQPQSIAKERGTYSYLKNPELFELELAALAAVHKAGYKNIHLILPFVRTVEEFIFCRHKVESVGLTQVEQFQLWIMAEVPSVLFLLPEYVKAGVQGISIGTNDFTQLLLGIDREQEQLAQTFDQPHPALMAAIAQLIHMATDAGIPCSICGQAPALYPEMIESLVKWGITSISVEPEAVQRTYQAIARAEQRIILEAARRQPLRGSQKYLNP